MVFTRVEIWRGVILTKSKLVECMDILFGEHKENEDVHDMIFNINQQIACDRIRVEKIFKCCHGDENECAILGIKLTHYLRKLFAWQDVKSPEHDIMQKIEQEHQPHFTACGTLLEPDSLNQEEKVMEQDDIKQRCGYYYRCDTCIKMTMNGSYPVEEIASKTVECSTYCFYCNQDRCDKETHNEAIMTFESLLDEMIDSRFGEIQAVDEKMGEIKNYYVLNDCLHC